MPHLLHETNHSLNGRRRIIFQAEREGQVEQQLRVRRALDVCIERLVHGEREVTLEAPEVAHQAVVDPDPLSVAEGVAVRLLDGRTSRGADVGHEQR